MNYQVGLAALGFMARLGRAGYLEAYGVQPEEFKRFVGDLEWLSVDKSAMQRTLFSLIEGSIAAQSLPSFPLPAEYVAAGIAMFVSPVNVWAACTYATRTHDADSLSRMGSQGQTALPEPVTTQRLFALVMQLYSSSERSAARSLFEKKTNLSLEYFEEGKTAKVGK